MTSIPATVAQTVANHTGPFGSNKNVLDCKETGNANLYTEYDDFSSLALIDMQLFDHFAYWLRKLLFKFSFSTSNQNGILCDDGH
jgi:hypothetical protein